MLRIRSRFRDSAVAAMLLATAAGCMTNPATGARQFSLISEAQEIQLGQEYDQQFVAELGLYPDQSLQQYVQQIGQRMAALSERPNLPWSFRLVDDPVVNAFALPGGYIYVTRGILAHLNSEAELASVIGHEIGHVTARHSVARMSSQQLAQLGLGIGSILRPDLQPVVDVAGVGLGLLFLSYGRGDEREADDLGLRYMSRAGYDPREMPGVFSMLEAVSEAHGGGRIPEWLSSHPDPGNRRDRILEQIAQLPDTLGSRTIERTQYLRRLDGLIFGENPREGFFRGQEFLHPEMAFRLTFPTGWQTRNMKQAVIAVSQNQDAIIELQLAEQSSPEAAAREFFMQQGVRGGPARSTTINGLPAATGTFMAQSQSGSLFGAAAFISHGGQVFQLLGYSPEQRWNAYQNAIIGAIESFARLTERAALDVQPQRIRIVEVNRQMTLESFAAEYAPGVDVETIALLNNLRPGAILVPGQLAKAVTGNPPPGASSAR
ncbi:MAG TPA: M48 family metalloprotease [Longimicrobiales bacterium]|nr:M48 family metalloprotease [Longimicrobiales bacterium]